MQPGGRSWAWLKASPEPISCMIKLWHCQSTEMRAGAQLRTHRGLFSAAVSKSHRQSRDVPSTGPHGGSVALKPVDTLLSLSESVGMITRRTQALSIR